MLGGSQVALPGHQGISSPGQGSAEIARISGEGISTGDRLEKRPAQEMLRLELGAGYKTGSFFQALC